MKKYLLVTILLFCGKNIRAQQLDSIFENPAIQEINRLPMRASYFPFEEVNKAQTGNPATSTRFSEPQRTVVFSLERRLQAATKRLLQN